MRTFFVILSLVVAVAVVAYQERFSIASSYASLFVVDTATKGADAILILSGNIETRSAKALELHKEGYSTQIWTFSAIQRETKYPDILKSQNVLLAEILTHEGLDKLYILPSVKKNGATSTFDEAYDLVSYLQSNPLNRVILVTDGFHTLRSKIAFEKVFKKFNIQTKLEFAPSFSPQFKLDEWYKYEKSLYRLLVKEPLGLIYYYFSDSNSKLYVNM